MKRIICFIMLAVMLCAAGCSPALRLPPAEPDGSNEFGIDKNININTIDDYLGRDDVVYRDVRMLFDPAGFGAIGGEADLSRSIEGFKIVPFPYIATLQQLPVDNAYVGNCLYAVEWNEDGTVKSAAANYRESEMALKELFPQDKAIFLMCGGGGYAGMLRRLLIHLGWDGEKIYNLGANWSYDGEHALELVVYPEAAEEKPLYAAWRADYAYIAFEKMEKLEK